jgi:hypothetical protein
MAKENQGLHIALIVFVMLTIISGVMAFMFYRSYSEKVVAVQGETDKLRKMQKDRDEALADNDNLKQMIGVGSPVPVTTVRNDFTKEMAAYMGSFPEANRNYKATVDFLNNSLQTKSAALAAEQASSQALKTTLAQREKGAEMKIAEALAGQQKASEDLQAQTGDYSTRRKEITDQQESLRQDVDKTKKKAEEETVKFTDAVARLEKEKTGAYQIVARRQEEIDKLRKPTFEVASGKIEWINQAQRSAWINLGRADHLNRLTTFRVYDGRTGDVTRAAPKASIEVIQILGLHLAEARIIEDKINNPILPGDVIHTPMWSPGQQKHFALAGLIDVDRDGKSDLDLVLNLIRMNGGVVDCWQGEDGKMNGKITADTNYLIRGPSPDETASKVSTRVFTDAAVAADNFAVKKVTLQEFLAQVGYRPESRIVRYGQATPPGQVRTPAGEGPSRKSTGTTSELPEQRKPPAKKAAKTP